METKKLIILFITFLLVISCTREIWITDGEEPQEKVPVSLKFVLDGAVKTKSSDWKYDDFFPEIREKEQIVTNILLVVFKNRVLEEYDYYTTADFTQDPDDYTITLSNDEEGDLLDLEPGPHYFYAIMNIPGDLYSTVLSILENQKGILTKEVFEKTITSYSLDDLTGSGDHFIMTNTTTPPVRNIYSQEQIEAPGNDLHNNVTIQVGRAVGKISFAYVADEVETGELHGGLSDISYKIVNNPTQMYLMPVIENDILLTPHYNYTSYPTGYFTPWIKDAGIENHTTESPWLPATTRQTLNDGKTLAYGYCMENHNKSPLKSTSTMLLVKAKFTPAVWLNGDGTKGNASNDGTFYRIGQYNSRNELYAYFQGYYNEDPKDVIRNLPSLTATSGGGYYQADRYEQGLTYYGFWPSNKDLFQVKRNNYYKIAITHIHGAGYPGPGGTVNPDVDPDEELTRGRLAVIVESWIDENQIITIGETPEEDDEYETGGNIPGWEEDEQKEELGSDNKFN